MPGPEIKNWATYHALRQEGKSKESAARIANAQAKKAALKEVYAEYKKPVRQD